jgi:hypothetical protein
VTEQPFSKIFAMSSFEALRNIRSYRRRHPELPLPALVGLIEKLDAGGLDYDGASYLDQLVPGSAEPAVPASFYRNCIESVIHQQPVWIKTIILGRRKFTQKLSRDQEQCFRSAGLLEASVEADILE